MIESSKNLDMDYLLICAIAERVALVMDDATRSLSRYYEYHAIAQGGPSDWHYWCMVKARWIWTEAERVHGELHTLDAAARVFEASEGALGWCMTSQPFPDA